jgi:hypothetical protein
MANGSADLEASLADLLGAASVRGGTANLVRSVLVPVEPSPQFVRDLGRSLGQAAARSRQSLLRRYRTAIVVGAAAFASVASLAGIVVLIVRQRSRMGVS